MRAALIGLCLLAGTAAPPDDIGWALTIDSEAEAAVWDSVHAYYQGEDVAPVCWEDEAVVVIVDYTMPPGADKPGIGIVGCVPLDNLPVSGNRP